MSCGRTDLPPLAEGIGQVVLDLDGCLAEQKWPLRRVVGEPIAEGVALLRHYAEMNYSVCVYTSRPQVDEPVIWEWILRHKLPVDKVRCEKPMGAIYWDDRGARFERTNGRRPKKK